MAQLIHDFILDAARRTPQAPALALAEPGQQRDYAALAHAVLAAAQALLRRGVGRGERVAIYLDKCEEAVSGMFGAAAAGAVFVPVNPLLKPAQVAYILADCNVRVLVTSAARWRQLAGALGYCPDLHSVILTGTEAAADLEPAPAVPGLALLAWADCMAAAGAGATAAPPLPAPACIDSDMAAILYTSGSTGKPKGVVLSHRNLVAGAVSVASYLGNGAADRILCVLPFSFDYGLSQLTTAFASGACAVLMQHLLARDIIAIVARERITGLAGVPPLWLQLTQLPWPQETTLRYVTNSGGAMLRPTLDALRRCLPATQIYLMYGLTEAFRSTYLAPEQLAQRPGSIGKAVPNAEILVLRPDGSLCDVNEPGELVHRGALVAMGYWNDIRKTAERFKPVPPRALGLPLAELAVWSGDTVRRDADGYLYFLGRRDDMIKCSGYRISPTEIEEVLQASGLVDEAVVFGVAHPALGQAIVVLATAAPGLGMATAELVTALLAACKRALPAYMQPGWVEIREGILPRNPNGKLDRAELAGAARPRLAAMFAAGPA